MITIVGRGHSGTRALSQTLQKSGVFMGKPLNETGDLLPPEPMYKAVEVFSKRVSYTGNYTWDFSEVLADEPSVEFHYLVDTYLNSLMGVELSGWKLPETTLAFPWIVKKFPENKYIHLIREPRDNILGIHLTDYLWRFGIDCPKMDNDLDNRAISWKYHYDIVKATPKPKHWMEITFEEFVLKQDETLEKLSTFLGIPLHKIPVSTEPVGRYKGKNIKQWDFFENYNIPLQEEQ